MTPSTRDLFRPRFISNLLCFRGPNRPAAKIMAEDSNIWLARVKVGDLRNSLFTFA